MQSCYDGGRVSCDDCEKRPRGGLGRTPPSLPVLDRIEAEAKCVGEFGLGHTQPLAYGFDIDLGGNAHLITGLLSSQKCLDLIEAGHQVFKHFAHDLPPYLVKISSARVASSLRSFFDKLSFSFFGYAVTRKTGKPSLRTI